MTTAAARLQLSHQSDRENGPLPTITVPAELPAPVACLEPYDAIARRVAVVGTGQTARSLAAWLRTAAATPVRFEGFLDDDPTPGVETVGRIHDLERLARTHFLDEVIVCLPDDVVKARRAVFLARRLDLDVKVVLETFGCNLHPASAGMLGPIPVLSLKKKPTPAFNPHLKRVLDLVVSAGLLLLLLPVLVLISILIRLDSPGPALYCAPRMGRKGHPFLCCKFRTMSIDADRQKQILRNKNERSGPFFKLKHDPRVTPLGRLLRRYSLDELPQLWNVLRGDMSLVGPRPHPLDDHAQYTPEHMQRLKVTPGLTGLWQVMARSDPSFERSMALDCEYIEKQSLTMDLWILLRTIREVATGSGV
jgi:exopolysaccharide biosynthesis polyprenyl glycosylphosphotransferase